MRQRALEELERLPSLNANALHASWRCARGHGSAAARRFVDTVNAWLSHYLARENGAGGALARLEAVAEAWQRINAAARDTETYNLERKPLVFSVFGLLAEATGG